MAERRMFAKTIIDSDAFLEMPQSSQLLYFHLSMRADDDGFVNKPKTIMRMVGCKDDDMTVLTAKKFIIPFDSGIVVIKHWKIHNYIQKDRYVETKYKDEKAQLTLDENKSYTTCIQNVSNADTQVRLELGKVRLELDKSIADEQTPTKPKRVKKEFIPPTLEEVKSYAKERNSFIDPKKFFDFYDVSKWIDSKGIPVRNWKQKFITWEGRNTKKESHSGGEVSREL